MSKRKAPAWQVREMARQNLLDQIERMITAAAERAESESDLCRLLIRVFDNALENPETVIDTASTGLPNLSKETHETALFLFEATVQYIEGFKRSVHEGRALMADVLEWITNSRVDDFHHALTDEEFANPMLIFGANRGSDEILIPD